MRKLIEKPIFALVLIALAFFYMASWLGTPPGDIWNSPDETANAFWAGRVAEGEPLMLREFAVGIGAGVVHPRSFDVNGSALVPGSFPGIFLLYGALKVFTGLPFSTMTPLLTALAGLVLYALFRRLFGRETAFWSAVLFYIHPAVIYYSGRGLFHNVLLVDLLIFAVGIFALRPFADGFGSVRWADDVLAGGLLGLAVITRLSEAVWILPAALAFLPFLGKDRWRRIGVVIIGALLPLLILLAFNANTYGTLLGSGYSVPEPAVTEPAVEAAAEASGGGAGLLPFGFHPRLIVMHGTDYGLGIFWWYSLAGILGLTVFLMRWRSEGPRRRAALLVTAAVTVWLLVFYGSWFVRDRYDPTLVTIGTSYVRYFLPFYVLTLPWVAGGLIWLVDRLGLRRRSALAALAVVFALLSLRVSVARGDESLLAVRGTLRGNLEKREILESLIPPDAVVMTDRFDKVLFPDHTLFIPVIDRKAFETVATLEGYGIPAYWYGISPSDDRIDEWSGFAGDAGLDLNRLGSPVEGEDLFELVRHEQPEDEDAQ